MSEQVVTFGEHGGLVGVIARPDTMGPEVPWFLLWNTGLHHRVGVCRLNVQLARRLAGLGIPSLRFDLSGLGDSAARADAHCGKARAVADARDAMAYLEASESATHFAVAGLCTGADYAYTTAVADERISAFICLDGMAYPTLRFRVERVRSFLCSWHRIVAFMRPRRWIAYLAPAKRDRDGTMGSDLFGWPPPPHRQAVQEMKRLIERGTRSLWIYSGESFASYNYTDQFRDMFGTVALPDTVAYAYFKTSDHLFADYASRTRLIDHVCKWVAMQYPRNSVLPCSNR